MEFEGLHELLEQKYLQYNTLDFIEQDPISIPHQFSKKEDIELAAFWVATIAWGQRPTILKNGNKLMGWMDHEPHSFTLNASKAEVSRLADFVHRTFNGIDAMYFQHALCHIYRNGGMETIFSNALEPTDTDLRNGIIALREVFFSLPNAPKRTLKHLPDITRGAAAKRFNMFLRWMVRKDGMGVDFGLWDISPSLLLCPLDLHTGRVARSLGLLQRKQDDWKAVLELTEALRKMDADDPVKYDFALFGMGVYDGIK